MWFHLKVRYYVCLHEKNYNLNWKEIVMTDNQTENPPNGGAKETAKKALKAADKAAGVVGAAGDFFGAIKWVAIAAVMVMSLGIGWKIYQTVRAPLVYVAEKSEAVGEAVESGVKKVGEIKNTAGEKMTAAGDNVTERLQAGKELVSEGSEALAGGAERVGGAITDTAGDLKAKSDAMVENLQTGGKEAGKSLLEGATEITIDRLDIPLQDLSFFGQAATMAFDSLLEVEPSKASGIANNIFRRRYLGGSEGRVCALNVDFGQGDTAVQIAVDHNTYDASNTFSDQKSQTIRLVVIDAEGDPVGGFNTSYDYEVEAWGLKWNATTTAKPVSDQIAEARVKQVLEAAASGC